MRGPKFKCVQADSPLPPSVSSVMDAQLDLGAFSEATRLAKSNIIEATAELVTERGKKGAGRDVPVGETPPAHNWGHYNFPQGRQSSGLRPCNPGSAQVLREQPAWPSLDTDSKGW